MTDWPEPFIRAILTPRGDGLRTLTPPPSCPYPGSRRWRSTVPLVVTAALIVIAAIVWAAAGWAQTPGVRPGVSSSGSASSHTECRQQGAIQVCTTQSQSQTTVTTCRMVGQTLQCNTQTTHK